MSGLALVAVPKCPLCIAAYLSVAGLSAGVAIALARLLQLVSGVAAVAVLAIVLAGLARQAYRARRRDETIHGAKQVTCRPAA